MAFSFGSSTPAPAPASTGGGFGAAAAPSTTAPVAPLFGSTPAPAPSTSFSFGSTPAPAPSAFGSTPAPAFGSTPAPAPSAFGSTPAPAGGGLFGSTTTTAPAPSAFGSTPASAPGGGLFGSTPAPATGLFGSTPAPAPGIFGATPAPAQQQQQQTTLLITPRTPYSALPPDVKRAIDTIHEELMRHKKTMANVETMSPALLSDSTAVIVPADAAAGGNRDATLKSQLESVQKDLQSLQESFKKYRAQALRVKQDYEKSTTQSITFGVWPVEAVAARRGITLSTTTTTSSAHSSSTTTNIKPDLQELLKEQMSQVDRIERMPSPYMWQTLEKLETHVKKLMQRLEMLQQELNFGNEIDVASTVHLQQDAIARVAHIVSSLQNQMNAIRTKYHQYAVREEDDVLYKADREETQRQLHLEQAARADYVKARGQAQSTAPATGGGLFGSTPTGGLFGRAPAPATSGGLFGSTSTPAPATGGFFGSTPTPAPATGGLFGSTPTPAPATGGLFGSNPAPAPATGGLFGGNPAPAPAFGATPAPAFGATPAPAASTFGATPAPAFGATTTPTFGATPATPRSKNTKSRNRNSRR